MMKIFKQAVIGLTMAATVVQAHADDLCPNMFPNFITDVCWSCMFPFRLFGVRIMPGNNEDFDTDASGPACLCLTSLKVGVPIGFWEMAYIVDVHTSPGCLPTLAGLELPITWNTEQYAKRESGDDLTENAFSNSAYYVSPLMYLLEAVIDDDCSDRSPFDVGWTSEFDPSWADDQLALLKMPISFVFGTLPGVLASGPDAIAANIGFPLNEIFWQAGSWGPIYPLTGTVSQYGSFDQLGRMTMTKMLAEAHAMSEVAGLFAKGSGRSYACEPGEADCSSGTTKQVMCAGSPSQMPSITIMKKKQYKIQRLFPTPESEHSLLGGCCTPIGRSSMPREMWTQLPVSGYKDFGYSVFRKRDCCGGVVSPATP